MSVEEHLPAPHQPHEIAACVGLISDTHYPLRCEQLPATLFDQLAGVDLLLHAGDVGELAVLDQLGTIAPVVAVHGNDETDAAQQTLPYQQVVAVADRRILLWHSHIPDRQAELAARTEDAMVPKFQRTIDRAMAAGATLAVFGHWHIPLIYRQDGVTVINPGAIASGNFFTRQTVQSVALLYLLHDGSHQIAHIDLIDPTRPLSPHQTWPASFQSTLATVSESILTPELDAFVRRIRPQLSADARQAMLALFMPLVQRCWRGERTTLSLEEILWQIETAGAVSPAVRAEIQSFL